MLIGVLLLVLYTSKNIGYAQNFSGIASIALNRGFSGEILIEVRRTLLWKTKSNRSIHVMEDRISRLLYYCHEDIL